jgi:hypothetical protein
MKNIRASLSPALIIVLAVVFTSVYPAAGQNKPTVSKKELKVLLKTATQPADHQRIADYYRQEAARLTASAREHRELAVIYEKTPPNAAMETKHGTSVEGVGHCRRWAQLEVERAKEAEALAAIHEDMAKEAGKK